MRMARPTLWGLCGLMLVMWTTGCGNDQLRIQALEEELAKTKAENDRLRGDLANAVRERDMWRARADELARQLAGAQQPTETKGPWQRFGPYTWTSVGSDFLFGSGKATLTTEGRAKLAEIVGQIHAMPEGATSDIWVLGHTDTDPIKYTKDKWTDNLDLSCNRAMTVERELLKLGLPPQRTIAGGHGEWFPKATGNSKAAKAENRRVEIILVPARPPTGVGGGATTPLTGPGPTETTTEGEAPPK